MLIGEILPTWFLLLIISVFRAAGLGALNLGAQDHACGGPVRKILIGARRSWSKRLAMR